MMPVVDFNGVEVGEAILEGSGEARNGFLAGWACFKPPKMDARC
jgi:hypothetical protein